MLVIAIIQTLLSFAVSLVISWVVGYSLNPLGLLAGRTLQGRQLAKIRESTLKPDSHIAGKRRMAYEFDAADTLDSCLYPAIAKMLRGEGVELFATTSAANRSSVALSARSPTNHGPFCTSIT